MNSQMMKKIAVRMLAAWGREKVMNGNFNNYRTGGIGATSAWLFLIAVVLSATATKTTAQGTRATDENQIESARTQAAPVTAEGGELVIENGMPKKFSVTDSLLAPLGNNGGQTDTHVLIGSSPAINAGNNCVTSSSCGATNNPPALVNDQCIPGLALNVGSSVDIGAFEVQGDPTGAAALVVTTTADVIANDGLISLREAIRTANAQAGDDIVTVPAGTYTLTIAGQNENAALTGDLDVTAANDTLTINGAGAHTTIIEAGTTGGASGNGIDRVFEVLVNASLVVDGVTVRNGKATDSSGSGGGIRNVGNLTIQNSTLSDNFAHFFGGGIINFGLLQMFRSTLSGNSASEGGGINNRFNSTAFIQNSTLSGNTAVNGNQGGGIFNNSSATVTVQSSTLSGNTAGNGGGIIAAGTVNLGNTIVANNTGGTRPDIGGNVVSQGFNLIGNASGANFSNNTTGNQLNVNPMLGTLGNNGGPTDTFALLAGSPAINAGSNALIPSGVTTDQRGAGFARQSGTAVDIGAFEVQMTTTAATASIGGRVLTPDGRGLVNARVTLTDQNGTTRTVSTTSFGYFSFAEVSAGEIVVLTVSSKRYSFAAQVFSVTEESNELQFVGQSSKKL